MIKFGIDGSDFLNIIKPLQNANISKLAKIALFIALLNPLYDFLKSFIYPPVDIGDIISVIVISFALAGNRIALYLCFLFSALIALFILFSSLYPSLVSFHSSIHMSKLLVQIMFPIILSAFSLIIYFEAIKKKPNA